MLFRVLLLVIVLLIGRTANAAEIIGAPIVTRVTADSAMISWITDVQTGSRVNFGTAADQLTGRVEGGVSDTHQLTLTGLVPSTRYFFAVGTARKKLAMGEFATSARLASVPAVPLASAAARPPPTPKSLSLFERIFGPKSETPTVRATWGNPASLPDHFARHGADFRATDADDYARMAWEFGQRAKQGGLLVKVDDDGTSRVFDPRSGAFAAYNSDGTTKTFFKPNSRDYFARQPGRAVTARPPP